MVKQADRIDDMISEIDLPEVPSANSGISDFSSAIDITSRRDENASKEMPSILIESDLKENTNHQARESDTLAKQDSQIAEPKVTRKSKPKPKSDRIKVPSTKKDLKLPIAQEPQVLDLPAKSSLLENSSSSGESSALEVEKQELNTQSQASIGLPQWKPRQR